MAKELKRIDITHVPEVLRIVEEVRDTSEPRVLRRGSEDVAILMPFKRTRRVRRTVSKEALEAFRSAAGSWKDVDTDKFLADIYESRQSSRPPVEL